VDHQSRLLCLAHLKNGETPAKAAEKVGLSYATALKLRKQLHEAESSDAILELFDLPEAALEILLNAVTNELTPAIEAFGVGELVEEQVHELSMSVAGGKLLDQQMQAAAIALTDKIAQVAVIANNAETVLILAKSLSELHVSFFGAGGGISRGGSSNELGLPAPGSFERHLRS